jgi:CTP:molybdopterin cytidylyltransferase MocA
MAGQMVFPFAQTPPGRLSRSGGRGAASSLWPRISRAVVRVPDPRHHQLDIELPSGQPQIYVHEGARQALVRRLELAHQRPVLLSVTDNYRQMISSSLREGILQARVHHMFLDAPALVQEALVRYVVKQDRAASQVVGQYIDDNGHRIRASRPVSTPLVTQGRTHDLLSLFQKLNHAYFGGAVDALITWGKRTRALKPRRTIKLGSYSAVERLIRIHPVLDRPWVPRYFVSYVIYHEMLHHVMPASHGNGRRMLHPPQFLARERLFRDYERALAWEQAHVGRLLRT